MKRLVDSGASVNFHDDQWLSPLHIAAGVTRSPEEPSSRVSTEDKVDVELVELLVRAKAAMRARDHSRWTALHYAVRTIPFELDVSFLCSFVFFCVVRIHHRSC